MRGDQRISPCAAGMSSVGCVATCPKNVAHKNMDRNTLRPCDGGQANLLFGCEINDKSHRNLYSSCQDATVSEYRGRVQTRLSWAPNIVQARKTGELLRS